VREREKKNQREGDLKKKNMTRERNSESEGDLNKRKMREGEEEWERGRA
jgi:hypothetical protein